MVAYKNIVKSWIPALSIHLYSPGGKTYFNTTQTSSRLNIPIDFYEKSSIYENFKLSPTILNHAAQIKAVLFNPGEAIDGKQGFRG